MRLDQKVLPVPDIQPFSQYQVHCSRALLSIGATKESHSHGWVYLSFLFLTESYTEINELSVSRRCRTKADPLVNGVDPWGECKPRIISRRPSTSCLRFHWTGEWWADGHKLIPSTEENPLSISKQYLSLLIASQLAVPHLRTFNNIAGCPYSHKCWKLVENSN